jgi:hypothetical protein
MRVSPTDPPLYLLDPDDVVRNDLPPHLRPFRAHARRILRWARAYLCRPHPALGREGPVCPYTEPSLQRGLFWLAFHPGADPPPGEVSAVVLRYRDWFLELEPVEEREGEYGAILLLFPQLDPARAPLVIDRVQSALKSSFVAAGLMIGQFHAGCGEPALWNPDFRPLRSPVPLLVVRRMVRTDAAFLTRRAEWLQAYLRRFGDAVPSRLRPVVREAAAAHGLRCPAP